MIKFRQKDFSFLEHIIRGAALGTAIGGAAGKLPIKFKVKGKDISGNTLAAGGAILGAALGALSGAIVEGSRLISRKTTVDNRLMSKVVEDLEKTGFQEGRDFTRDPKKANDWRTKVCIVVSRNSGDLRVLINTVADAKLQALVDRIIKNLPNTSAVTKKASDRYNDITITTISDSSADVGLIAGLAEKFIRSKYPVYLIEVG